MKRCSIECSLLTQDFDQRAILIQCRSAHPNEPIMGPSRFVSNNCVDTLQLEIFGVGWM